MVSYKTKNQPTSNSTANGTFHERRQVTQWGRLITTCPEGQIFLESRGEPDASIENPIQRYVYTCIRSMSQKHAITGARSRLSHSRRVIHRGQCLWREVCIDVPSSMPNSAIKWASCVGAEIFEEWVYTKDGTYKPILDGEIFRPLRSMFGVFSQLDEKTPVEMDSFEVDTWSNDTSTRKSGAAKNVQKEDCRDCAEIQVDMKSPDTDTLKVEAKLLNSVSATALAGILWLSFAAAG